MKATEPVTRKMSGATGQDETDPVAKQMAQSSPKGSSGGSSKRSHGSSDPGIDPPKKGQKFRCEQCGMEIQVTVDCKCEEPGMVHFHCCGKELVEV